MTITELMPIVLAWGAGLAIGLFYFGSLWIVIGRLPESRHPVLLMVISTLVRTIVAVGSVYLVMGDHWERAVACLVGMMMVRAALASRLHPNRLPPPASRAIPVPEKEEVAV